MIGVCIKYFHENYGGMLQAYATVSMLEKMGIDYELIRYEKVWKPQNAIKALPRLMNSVLLNDKYEGLKKKIGLKMHPDFAANHQVRMKSFEAFRLDHFIRLSPIYKGYEALCSESKKYSAVLTGSDQLWSPSGLPTNYYNLQFVPEEIRKISWASSFGVSRIPWYQVGRTRDYLNRIEYISMRENRGAEIVKELTGKEVPVLMDPVFVFDRDEWMNLVLPEKPEWEPYIFCYFLGNNPEHRAAARELAERTGKKIVTLRHLDQYVAEDEQFGDYAPYDVDPARFLNILRNADYVCTDSFHGMAFSVLCEKQFLVFNRYSDTSSHSKNSRIESVCRNLQLEGRRYFGSQDILDAMDVQIDYRNVRALVQNYRERTKAFLEEAFLG